MGLRSKFLRWAEQTAEFEGSFACFGIVSSFSEEWEAMMDMFEYPNLISRLTGEEQVLFLLFLAAMEE